jgi:N-acetylneuraminate epimerase
MTHSRTNPLTRRGVLLAGAASATAVVTGVAVPPAPALAAGPRNGATPRVSWTPLPDVPANTDTWTSVLPIGESSWRQVGLAAMVAGAHDGYLIAAGGANFPETARTATRDNQLGKVYWADAFVLRRTGAGVEWLDARRTVNLYGVAGRERTAVASAVMRMLRSTNWQQFIDRNGSP